MVSTQTHTDPDTTSPATLDVATGAAPDRSDTAGSGHDTATAAALARLVLGALAVLVGAEVVVRLLEPSLDPVRDWPDSSYTVHHQRLDSAAIDLDYLVVGSSSAGTAVRPDLVAERRPNTGRGYTYWLAGPPLRSLADVTTGNLLARTEPETVVVAVTMREFNDNQSAATHHAALLEASPYRRSAGLQSWLDPIDDVLQRHLALARRRALVREPVLLWSDLTSPPLEPVSAGADGHLDDRDDARLADEPAGHLRQEAEALADYEVAAADLDSLAALLDDLARRRIRAVVVNLPVSEDFIELAPGGRSDYLDYRSSVEQVTNGSGAEWYDLMGEGWSDGYFADVNHLNARGAARIQPLLADLL